MFSTTLCYLERNRKYLMLHRVKKKADLNEGKWVGIGGKFEEGESPEDCLCREVKEETGFTLRTWKYRGIITFVSDKSPRGTEFMHLFTSDDFTGEERDCDEGVAEWIPVEDVMGLNLWAGDRIFLRYLLTDMPFFSLELVYVGDELTEAVLNGSKIDAASAADQSGIRTGS